jgi:hypothetical protein
VRNGPLRARFSNNAPRFTSQTDDYVIGGNGLASLRHIDQRKNIFCYGGLNFQAATVDPPAGALKGRSDAPRHAPMTLERLSRLSVRLTQKGADAAGVNMETTFALGQTYVDMACTVWADNDANQITTHIASFMNQVQNTSIYLRGKLEEDASADWLEATKPSHNDPIYFRSFNPRRRNWHEYLTDNPVRRQVWREAPLSALSAATKAHMDAGFEKGKLVAGSFENFFFGFVDDYLFLLILRPSDDIEFEAWTSAVGGGAVRSPSWDFATVTKRPVKGGEKIAFHARLVYKKWAGIDDVLKEVGRFQKPAGAGQD